MATHYTLPQNKSIDTMPQTNANEITKDYYNFLVGEINRGTIYRAVCRIENKIFGTETYHLISY